MTGIYKITNTINNKCYIGQAVDIEKRLREHQIGRKARTNTHLSNAIKKYGIENFTFETLEECSIEELDEREIFWINYFKTIDSNMLYNIAEGGHGGDTISNLPKEKYDAYIKKISKPRSEEFKKEQSERFKGDKNPMYGKPISESAKEKKRKYMTGRKWVNNGEKQILVKEPELTQLLNTGWKLGMLH